MTSDTNGTLVDGMIDGNIISVQGLPTMDGTYVFDAKAFNDEETLTITVMRFRLMCLPRLFLRDPQ